MVAKVHEYYHVLIWLRRVTNQTTRWCPFIEVILRSNTTYWVVTSCTEMPTDAPYTRKPFLSISTMQSYHSLLKQPILFARAEENATSVFMRKGFWNFEITSRSFMLFFYEKRPAPFFTKKLLWISESRWGLLIHSTGTVLRAYHPSKYLVWTNPSHRMQWRILCDFISGNKGRACHVYTVVLHYKLRLHCSAGFMRRFKRGNSEGLKLPHSKADRNQGKLFIFEGSTTKNLSVHDWLSPPPPKKKYTIGK